MKPQTKAYSSRRPEKRGFWPGVARHWQLYLMLVLPIIYILVFKYEPMYGAQIAFRRFTPIKGIAGSKWVGLENFQKFFSSPIFSRLIKNTVLLSLFSMLASLVLNNISTILGVLGQDGGIDLSGMMGGMYMGASSTTISVIPPWLVLGALVFATVVGFVAGIVPANKAVKISALEAIRHD